MRAVGVLAAIAVALAMQMTLARFTVGRDTPVDLVLVVVVYAALVRGPVVGLLAGTFGGLVQDALSGALVGVGGLAKTLVGFTAGVVGGQFIVAQPVPRFVVFFAASLAHAAVFYGVYALIGPRGAGLPYGAILSQAVGNALVGVVVFQVVAMLPRMLERRRARGGWFTR